MTATATTMCRSDYEISSNFVGLSGDVSGGCPVRGLLCKRRRAYTCGRGPMQGRAPHSSPEAPAPQLRLCLKAIRAEPFVRPVSGRAVRILSYAVSTRANGVPATASILAKLAQSPADDILTAPRVIEQTRTGHHVMCVGTRAIVDARRTAHGGAPRMVHRVGVDSVIVWRAV